MSPFGSVPIDQIILGVTFAAVLVAVVGTWPVCALLLRAYRRRIARGMRSQGAGSTIEEGVPARSSAPSCPLSAPAMPSPSPDRIAGAPRITVREAEVDANSALLGRARRRARRSAVVFGVAGLCFGVATTVAYGIVDHRTWAPLPALAYSVLFAWPLVPTVLALASAGRRRGWLAYAGYLALVVVLLRLAGIGLGEIVVVVVIPAAFILALGARSLRGAAWLVAPGLAVLGMAVLALYVVAVYLVYRAPFTAYTWSFLVAGVGLLVLLLGYGWAVSRLYEGKWASDQTLLILQWWLVAALCWSLLLGTQGRLAAVLGLTPYGLLALVLAVGNLTTPPEPGPPVRLLLLRTFGSRQRSSRLLYDLTRQWRWVGSVELITGTDLASEILEPDEFLDFLRGRTAQRFVPDVAALPGRLAALDLRPDRDGRYRVNELLCHVDTWRPAVAGLLTDVDAVLLDLREMTRGHAGVVHELELLVAVLPLARVVALVDATTDTQALQWALDRAVDLAPLSSPVLGDPAPTLRVVVLSVAGTDDLGRLVAALARAAEGSA